MTTTSVRDVCPAWCENADCRGEHHAYVGEYVEATGGLPRASKYGAGATWFPGIGVVLSWDTIDELRPCIALHISGERVDEQVDLHLEQARELLAHLQRAIDIVAN